MRLEPIISCIFFLLLPLTNSCAGVAMTIQNAPAYIEGTAAGDIDIYLFNGHSITSVKISAGKFRTNHTATKGLYEVVFFTKRNFYPKAVTLKAPERPQDIKIGPLKKMKNRRRGILTGVVYKPVSGGKVSEHTGISTVYKGEKVHIAGNGVSCSAITDESGVFTIELPEGEYDIILGAGKAGKATIEKGKTTIKNVQKGMVLVD